MPDWMHRLHNSRTARNATLGSLAIVIAGSCTGAAIANYTVAGMNTQPYTGGQQFAQSESRDSEPEWVRDTAMAATGDQDATAGFSSTATEAYSDASY